MPKRAKQSLDMLYKYGTETMKPTIEKKMEKPNVKRFLEEFKSTNSKVGQSCRMFMCYHYCNVLYLNVRPI